MLAPWLDKDGAPTHDHGISFLDPADLARFMTRMDGESFQIHVHALGDRAARDSPARRANGPADRRRHLAHLQVVHPDDVRRFAALGAVATVQPLWACRDAAMEELTPPYLEPAADPAAPAETQVTQTFVDGREVFTRCSHRIVGPPRGEGA